MPPLRAPAARAAAGPVADKALAEILGGITWPTARDRAARGPPLSEVERTVMPAILRRRFHTGHASPRRGAAPMGVRARIRRDDHLTAAPACRFALRSLDR